MSHFHLHQFRCSTNHFVSARDCLGVLRDHTHIGILWCILRIVHYIDFGVILSQGFMTILDNYHIFANIGAPSFLQYWRTLYYIGKVGIFSKIVILKCSSIPPMVSRLSHDSFSI